jgi:hypothetical protein
VYVSSEFTQAFTAFLLGVRGDHDEYRILLDEFIPGAPRRNIPRPRNRNILHRSMLQVRMVCEPHSRYIAGK